MASGKGKLVSERLKMLENFHIRPITSHATFCQGMRNHTVECHTPYTPKGQRNSKPQRPLRQAPAVPHPRRAASARPAAAAPAPVGFAESAEPLLPTAPLYSSADSSKPTRVRVLPTQAGIPSCALTTTTSPLDNQYAKESEHMDTSCTGQPGNVSSITGAGIAYLFAATSRFEKKIPTTRAESKVCLLFVLACLLFFVIYKDYRTRGDDSNETEIDEYFHHLSYSPDELLSYRGETLKAVSKEGILNENNCIVIERKKKSISNGRSEIGVVSSNEHRTFPGSLLLANQRLVDNSPDLLTVDRAPLTYTVNLPGLTSDGSFTIVPSFSEYQSAVNKVINAWFKKNPSNRSTPANFQSIESFAYSKELLRVKFGLDFLSSVIESNIDFNAMAKGEKLIKIFKFTQVFYTVTVEPTKNPSDLFDSRVTLREIMRKTDDKNPPVLVDSVSYGRNIYVKVETSSVEKQAELNLKVLDTKNGLDKAHDLKDLHIQVYVLGGHTNHTELINVEQASEIHGIITKFSKFSENNLGFPISYSSQFINNNNKVIVHSTTDFVESVRHDNCQKGIIKLIQRIWFVIWEVTWTEISYDENRNKIEKKGEWYRNGQVIKLPFESEDIEIPGFVEDLKVVVKVRTLLDSWRTLIDRSNIPVVNRREFYIKGRSSSEIVPPI